MIFNCCNENRKAAILGNPALNGIDYLEVLDHQAPVGSPRQRTLLVYCLKNAPAGLLPSNVVIEGGESITGIMVQWIGPANAPLPQAIPSEAAYFAALANNAKALVIRTSTAGDFSPYVLRLVNNATQAEEDSFDVTEGLAGFDPESAEVKFSFKVECGPDFDCAPPAANCPPELPAPPPINYLAKDYGSFRGIMLDRLNQLLPSWGGSSEADLGIALAEVIAYAGDYLSYQQDAIATEAYIETARSRVSLRRHAFLADYHVHDGCNARAFIQLQVSMQVYMDQHQARFYTFAPGMPSTLRFGSGNEEAALIAGVIAFEPMQDAELFPEHNQMYFYTWGDANCCLPQGATEATLLGSHPNLKIGDVLIFKEAIGPQTGNPADADIRHRCAVRLTHVATLNGRGQPLVDPLFEYGTGNPITSLSQQPAPITEIQWSSADALPFPVCISSTFLNASADEQTLTNVSVVLGNVVLADQGLSFDGVPFPTVPEPSIYKPADPNADRCEPSAPVPVPVRYRPVVPQSPLTQAVPLPLAGGPVTPGVVHLLPNAPVSLTDANGFMSLAAQADDPLDWPQFFGILVTANAVNPAHIDLSVVYDPSGGASPVTLETFTDLSLVPADPDFAVKEINSVSQFITVSVPAAVPALGTFSTTPAMLPNSGTIDLQDDTATVFMTVQATNPLAWPASFGILSQGIQQQPDNFNLLVVYDPPSGGVGVQAPIVVEQFNGVSLENVADLLAAESTLVTVQSFEEEPNPGLSAADLINYDASQAVPVIKLKGVFEETVTTWAVEPDLMESGPADRNFVVEIEFDGTASLRFGDNTNGLAPVSETSFTASYRIGNGSAGNVGADSLVFLAADPRIISCTNPLPATGGVDPETMEQIRRRAPQAFMTQERAVTMADYEAVAESNPQVDKAVATLRWTGSWHTVFVTAEPTSAGNLTPALSKALKRNINRYRLAGQDLQLESPEYVPLQIELIVCVEPDYFQNDVQAALLVVLGSGPNGLFHPGAFTFGQTVYLSPIYAAARTVTGVCTVTAKVFAPQGVTTSIYLAAGEIPLGPFQIARMDNDRSFPNHGQLTLDMEGGK
ncbi:MAG TPA: putative baseplate assembly protein [Verrucomicrobiae bacterium]